MSSPLQQIAALGRVGAALTPEQPKKVSRRCNGGDRGNVEQRRRRREWLLQTYRADMDVITYTPAGEELATQPACRCYRCGQLLTLDTLTVDRIIPGIKGGTYRRDNIRPACSRCNTETGLALRWSR